MSAATSYTALADAPPMAGMPRLSTVSAPLQEPSSALLPAGDEVPATSAASEVSVKTDDTLTRIRERGRILLGYRQTAVPFSYVDAQDQPMGLAWALCQRIVPALQREMAMPELRSTPVRIIEQMRGPLIKGDAIDIDCAPSTVTAAREQQVAFSLPYYAAHVRLMVRRGAGIDSIDDLRGLRLAVVQGTTAERLVRAQHARAGFQLLMARDYDDAFRMLRERRAQALALDDVLLEGLRATSKTPDAYRIVGEPLSGQAEYYALVMPKDDPAFKDKVDAVLAAMFRSGEMARLQRESFRAALSSRGHDLPLAPSAETMALWERGARYGAEQEASASSPAAGS
ncbi:amino acid ABC transporter substrate-binding protein [Pandoraea sp. ISTKB]|uniref:amino acid ABC transporter substrate-binding protein n=1 Tax=Pandoraea sp. ISTKB TaxID=1586708 RepID=UPI00147D1F5A|nr:amino acid ABC transporter substrate-binding protein [Pandoraea sp. ISTKB]